MGMQEIDENNVVLQDYIVNTWGGSYYRLEQEEAILLQERLNAECGKEMDELMAKVRKVALDFGIEVVIGAPEKPGNSPKK